MLVRLHLIDFCLPSNEIPLGIQALNTKKSHSQHHYLAGYRTIQLAWLFPPSPSHPMKFQNCGCGKLRFSVKFYDLRSESCSAYTNGIFNGFEKCNRCWRRTRANIFPFLAICGKETSCYRGMDAANACARQFDCGEMCIG